MRFLYGNEEQIEKRLSDDGDFECDNFLILSYISTE